MLFDIDGTLLLTGGAGQRAFAQTFAHEFGVAEISRDVAFAGRTDRAISQDLMAAHGVDPSEANWRRFREGYVERLPAALEEVSGRVLPGILPLLDELGRRANVALGILTGNMRDGAQMKLRHYGLGQRFSFGGYGDDAYCRDEVAAAAVDAAERHLEVRNEGARQLEIDLARSGADGRGGIMVIGDTVHDVTCARSIGACAVAVATGHTPRSELSTEDPDLLLDDLSDHQMLLHAIDSQAKP